VYTTKVIRLEHCRIMVLVGVLMYYTLCTW